MDATTDGWETILQGNTQVVLYNPTSKALTVTGTQDVDPETPQLAWDEYDTDDVNTDDTCPYCHRPMFATQQEPASAYPRVPNYFHLLAESTSTSRAQTPPGQESASRPFGADAMAEGYFDTFFREEKKLGMGANGSVFLCQHVLDGNPLGHFAVKKIAVGSSHEYLVKILREVRLLETLRHQNIITYHHAWLESCRFSAFGPSVPTLHVLMQWAEGGSLDDFIALRQGLSASGDPIQSNGVSGAADEANMTKAERIAAFRSRNRNQGSSRARAATMKAIHLLSPEEILSLFGDVTDGLAFLHGRAILHLDLKPGNVLLTWDTGALIPRAMLSDFGASKDMLQQNAHTRTGITGTLEYTAPEILRPDPTTGIFREMDTKSDIWSLGIILHKLIFFHTPYHDSENFAVMQEEITHYGGFFPSQDVRDVCMRRGLPSGLLKLLQTLLDLVPIQRPTAERVLGYVRTEAMNFVRPTSPPKTRMRRQHHTPTPSLDNTLVRAANIPPAPDQYTPTHHHPHHQRRPSPFGGRRHLSSGDEGEGRLSSSSSTSTIHRHHERTHSGSHSINDIDGVNGINGTNGLNGVNGRQLGHGEEEAGIVPPSQRDDLSDDGHGGAGPSLRPRPTRRRLSAAETDALLPTAESRMSSTAEMKHDSMVLQIPASTSRSLRSALWVMAGPGVPDGALKMFKAALLMGKIVTLAQLSGGVPPSIIRSTVICLASALAVIDVWRSPSNAAASSSFAPSGGTTYTVSESPRQAALISSILAIMHIILLSLLQYL